MRFSYLLLALAVIGAVLFFKGHGVTGAVVQETVQDATESAAKVQELLAENEQLQDEVARLKSATTDFKEVVGLRKALDSAYDEKASCEQALAKAEQRVDELEKKNRVLERWVAACREELDLPSE